MEGLNSAHQKDKGLWEILSLERALSLSKVIIQRAGSKILAASIDDGNYLQNLHLELGSRLTALRAPPGLAEGGFLLSAGLSSHRNARVHSQSEKRPSCGKSSVFRHGAAGNQANPRVLSSPFPASAPLERVLPAALREISASTRLRSRSPSRQGHGLEIGVVFWFCSRFRTCR